MVLVGVKVCSITKIKIDFRSLCVVFLFALMSIAPYIPYFNLVNGFNFGDAVVVVLFLISLCSLKLKFPLLSFFPAFIFFISIVSAVTNIPGDIYVLENLTSAAKWLYFFMLTVAIFNYIKTEQDVASVYAGVFIGLTISILLTWYEWSHIPTLLGSVPMLHSTNDDMKFIINRNYVGFFISIGASLSSVYCILSRELAFKGVSFLILMFFIISSLLTFSKGTWLATLISVLCVFALLSNRKKKKISLYVPVIFLSLYLAYVLLGEYSLIEKLTERVGGSSSTNLERFHFAVEAVIIFLNNMFFGVGPGGYRDAAIFFFLFAL